MTGVVEVKETKNDTQWDRLCGIHCATWNGVRSWYNADGTLERSVVAERILSKVSDTRVSQVNNYFEEGEIVDHEEWFLERSEDDNTYFPPKPSMRSYFAKDGSAFWGRHYTPGEPFKFEVFFMRGDHRMSIMPRWKANGELEGFMHVREVRGNAPVSLWSKEVNTTLPDLFPQLPKGKAVLATVKGDEREVEASFAVGFYRALLNFPDGLVLDVPSQLPRGSFDALVQWRCGGMAPENVIVRFPGVNQLPEFIRFE